MKKGVTTITILKRIPSYKLKRKINKGRHRSPVEEEKEAPCRRRIVEEVRPTTQGPMPGGEPRIGRASLGVVRRVRGGYTGAATANCGGEQVKEQRKTPGKA